MSNKFSFFRIGAAIEFKKKLAALLGEDPGPNFWKVQKVNAQIAAFVEKLQAAGIPVPDPDRKVASADFMKAIKTEATKPVVPVAPAPAAAKIIPLPTLPAPPAIPANAITDNGLTGLTRIEAGIKSELARTMPLRTAKVAASTKEPTRDQLLQVIKIADPGSLHAVRDDWTDAEVKAEAESCLFRAHLRAPFMRTDAVLADEMWRSDASKIKGTARVVRGLQQNRVNQILQ